MFKTLLILTVLCLLCVAPGLAHGSFVYVSNYGDGTISQFRANPNGTLTPLNPPTVKAYPRCHSLAVAQGRYLYVTSARDWSKRDCLVSQFRIGDDGRLTLLSPPRVFLPYVPYLMAIEPSSPYLYVLNHFGSISQFYIKKNGTLAPLSLPAAGLPGNQGYSVAFDRQHSVFYVSVQSRMTNEWLGGVSALRAEKDGTLRGVSLHLPDDGCLSIGKYAPLPPYQVILSHQRRSVYILYLGLAPAGNEVILTQYRILADGGLSSLKPAQIRLSGTPQEAVVDPKSRYCYVFVLPQYLEGYPVKTDEIILARYAIQGNGALGKRSQQTFTAPKGLFNPVFDPSGHTLYLLTRNGISPFHVKQDGSIVPLSPRIIRTGFGPLGMVYVQK